MKILITGSSGFLGRNLLKSLVKHNHDIYALSRSPLPTEMEGIKNLVWIQKDLLETAGMIDLNLDVDVIVHLAGATLGAEISDSQYLSVNEKTLINLLTSENIKTKKLIYASSQEVYGNINCKNVNEDTKFGKIENSYACSKINAENWLEYYQLKHQIPLILLRMCGYIEGGGIIDYIIEKAIRDEDIELYSEGSIYRDYLPINEGVNAMILSINKKFDPSFNVFNIGSGESFTTLEFAEAIVKVVGSKSNIVLSKEKAAKDDFIFDISKSKEILNFQPESLMHAVKKYACLKNING